MDNPGHPYIDTTTTYLINDIIIQGLTLNENYTVRLLQNMYMYNKKHINNM